MRNPCNASLPSKSFEELCWRELTGSGFVPDWRDDVRNVAQKNFATAHVMGWYVLIFAVLGVLSFADCYSLIA